MKKKAKNNNSGIVICDSITMSVKKKRPDLRRLEAVFIAVTGFVAVVMSFLEMFDFKYNSSSVINAAVIFSVIYIVISLTGKKALWISGATFAVFAIAVYKYITPLVRGFKYVYNVIYCDSMKTKIKYYKFLDYEDEKYCITLFFVFCIWILALVIYTFTINRPNPLIIVLFTFPIIEVGLYNGIDIPIFWGILAVAYWLAVLAVCTIDLGEFYGGTGGFVRKDNLFFPKRQMRLKVTEKCAVIIIVSAAVVTALSMAVMKLTDYKRSEELNQKRIEIKEAVTSFTFDDFADSISNLTDAFGFTINYESHKLGNKDRIKYKNVTDIIVTVDRQYDGAIYLKGYSGAVYGDNEWLSLDEDVYKKSSGLFDDFKEYGIYPQDFPYIFSSALYSSDTDATLWIEAKRKKNKSFSPYVTENFGNMKYLYDNTVSSKKSGSYEYSYKFMSSDVWDLPEILGPSHNSEFAPDRISDSEWKEKITEYCEENDILNSSGYAEITSPLYVSTETIYQNASAAMAALLEVEYRDFVYDNYLQLPDNSSMSQIKAEFEEILSQSEYAHTAEEKLLLLQLLREKVNSMSEYSLSPGKTPSNRDFVNYFLLENHKGYCTHYATSGVILARMAGIPARYATGYVIVGDDFSDSNRNNDGTYTINVKDNRSHAWTEVYLDGYGWMPFEFTAGYSEMSINTETSTTTTTAISTTSPDNTTTTVTAESQPSSSKQTRKSTSQRTHTTEATTETVTTKTAGGGGSHGGSGTKASSVEINKTVVITIILILAIILFIALRRYLILKLRKIRFTEGAPKMRVAYMYAYTERLLNLLKFSKQSMQYTEYADMIESKLGSEYFPSGKFRKFVDTALLCRFSEENPDAQSVNDALAFTELLSGKIYNKSGIFRKIYMKILLVLI